MSLLIFSSFILILISILSILSVFSSYERYIFGYLYFPLLLFFSLDSMSGFSSSSYLYFPHLLFFFRFSVNFLFTFLTKFSFSCSSCSSLLSILRQFSHPFLNYIFPLLVLTLALFLLVFFRFYVSFLIFPMRFDVRVEALDLGSDSLPEVTGQHWGLEPSRHGSLLPKVGALTLSATALPSFALLPLFFFLCSSSFVLLPLLFFPFSHSTPFLWSFLFFSLCSLLPKSKNMIFSYKKKIIRHENILALVVLWLARLASKSMIPVRIPGQAVGPLSPPSWSFNGLAETGSWQNWGR